MNKKVISVVVITTIILIGFLALGFLFYSIFQNACYYFYDEQITPVNLALDGNKDIIILSISTISNTSYEKDIQFVDYDGETQGTYLVLNKITRDGGYAWASVIGIQTQFFPRTPTALKVLDNDSIILSAYEITTEKLVTYTFDGNGTLIDKKEFQNQSDITQIIQDEEYIIITKKNGSIMEMFWNGTVGWQQSIAGLKAIRQVNSTSYIISQRNNVIFMQDGNIIKNVTTEIETRDLFYLNENIILTSNDDMAYLIDQKGNVVNSFNYSMISFPNFQQVGNKIAIMSEFHSSHIPYAIKEWHAKNLGTNATGYGGIILILDHELTLTNAILLFGTQQTIPYLIDDQDNLTIVGIARQQNEATGFQKELRGGEDLYVIKAKNNSVQWATYFGFDATAYKNCF